MNIGTVRVEHDHDSFTITYTITDCSWYITETHLALSAIGMDGIPQTKSGSPKVGQFAFSDTHDYVKTVTYTIPFDHEDIADDDEDGFEWGETLCIAAHAVVWKKSGCEYVNGQTAWGDGDPFDKSWAMYFCYTPCKVPELPSGDITFKVVTGSNSYFTTTILSGGDGNAANGDYKGWCVDLDHTINTGVTYSGTLQLASGCTWNKVNWIINYAPSHGYDKKEIQAVIWNITLDVKLSKNMHASNTLTDDQLADATILRDMAKNKCGYVPTGENALFAVFVIPPSGKQLTIIEVDP